MGNFSYAEEIEETSEYGHVTTKVKKTVEVRPEFVHDVDGGEESGLFEPRRKAPDESNKGLVKAKIVQLRKPAKSASSKAKVCSGFMEVSEGRFSSRKVQFQNHNLYVFGHHLAKADLMYNVKAGDEYLCDVQVDPEGVLVVKKGFLGEPTTTPADKTDPDAVRWMGSRSLDLPTFKKWLNDELLRRPFFPLIADSEVIEVAFENFFADPFGGTGGLLRGESGLIAFEREDFYACGVQAGGDVDLRLLLRKGDRVKCLARDISSQERRRLKKFAVEELTSVAYLAFVGQKPKSASLKAMDSLELRPFLAERSIGVEEFESMRSGKQQQQQQQQQPVIKAAAADSNPLSLTKAKIVASAMNISSPEDPRNLTLLSTKEDVNFAIQVSRVFTRALLHQSQGRMKDLLMDHFGSQPEVALNAQTAQIASAANPIEAAVRDHAVKMQVFGQQQPNPMMEAQAKFMKTKGKVNEMKRLAELESKAMEVKAAKREASGAKEDNAKKMKSMLQQFKAAKEAKQQQQQQQRPRSKSRSKSPDIESVKRSQLETLLRPIELLRYYVKSGKEIEEEDDLIIFGKICYPKDTKTNYRVSRTSDFEPEFYSLETLFYFARHRSMPQAQYLRKALDDGVASVKTADRYDLAGYLTGRKDNVANLTKHTHKELNPHLFGLKTKAAATPQGEDDPEATPKEAVEAWKAKYIEREKEKKKASRFQQTAETPQEAAAAVAKAAFNQQKLHMQSQQELMKQHQRLMPQQQHHHYDRPSSYDLHNPAERSLSPHDQYQYHHHSSSFPHRAQPEPEPIVRGFQSAFSSSSSVSNPRQSSSPSMPPNEAQMWLSESQGRETDFQPRRGYYGRFDHH